MGEFKDPKNYKQYESDWFDVYSSVVESQIMKHKDKFSLNDLSWCVVSVAKIIMKSEFLVDEINRCGFKLRNEFGYRQFVLLPDAHFEQLKRFVSQRIPRFTPKMRQKTRLICRWLSTYKTLFDIVNFFCNMDNRMQNIQFFSHNVDAKFLKDCKKYSYFINESMLKLLLKLIVNKLDITTNNNNNENNFQIGLSYHLTTWYEFIMLFYIQSCSYLLCDENIPYSWNNNDHVITRHTSNCNKIYYNFLRNKILCHNKYNWQNTVGIWRSSIILTMYLFSNYRFSLSHQCKKVFEQNIGDLNDIETTMNENEYSIEWFDLTILSFIKNDNYHKNMILLDCMLGMKYVGNKYIHPKCKIFFKSIFNTVCDNDEYNNNKLDTKLTVMREREALKQRFCHNLSYYLDNRYKIEQFFNQYLKWWVIY